MSSSQVSGVPRALASVTRNLRGIPWWAAALAAFVPSYLGRLIGGTLATGPTVMFWAGLIIGALLACALVRRRAIFTAMVQMPIVCAAALVIANIGGNSGSIFYSAGVEVVRSFPAMAIATAVALCVGTLRIAAQPLRKRPSSAPVAAAHA